MDADPIYRGARGAGRSGLHVVDKYVTTAAFPGAEPIHSP